MMSENRTLLTAYQQEDPQPIDKQLLVLECLAGLHRSILQPDETKLVVDLIGKRAKSSPARPIDKQLQVLECLADLHRSIQQHDETKLVTDLIEKRAKNFAAWFKEKGAINDKNIERLVRLSVNINNVFTNGQSGVSKDNGIDTVLAIIFRTLKRGLTDHPPKSEAEKAVLRKEYRAHPSWQKRIPSSCTNAAEQLNKLIKLSKRLLAGDKH